MGIRILLALTDEDHSCSLPLYAKRFRSQICLINIQENLGLLSGNCFEKFPETPSGPDALPDFSMSIGSFRYAFMNSRIWTVLSSAVTFLNRCVGNSPSKIFASLWNLSLRSEVAVDWTLYVQKMLSITRLQLFGRF